MRSGANIKYVGEQINKLFNTCTKTVLTSSPSFRSPDAFKSNEITATVSELANSMAMGRSLNTIALQVGTFVLSKDPAQRRKKIMSPWVGVNYSPLPI